MFTEHRACGCFICLLEKLQLHEAAECDMKPEQGGLVLKRRWVAVEHKSNRRRAVLGKSPLWRRCRGWRKGAVSYLRHPLQDEWVGGDQRCGHQVSSDSYKSTFFPLLNIFIELYKDSNRHFIPVNHLIYTHFNTNCTSTPVTFLANAETSWKLD